MKTKKIKIIINAILVMVAFNVGAQTVPTTDSLQMEIEKLMNLSFDGQKDSLKIEKFKKAEIKAFLQDSINNKRVEKERDANALKETARLDNEITLLDTIITPLNGKIEKSKLKSSDLIVQYVSLFSSDSLAVKTKLEAELAKLSSVIKVSRSDVDSDIKVYDGYTRSQKDSITNLNISIRIKNKEIELKKERIQEFNIFIDDLNAKIKKRESYLNTQKEIKKDFDNLITSKEKEITELSGKLLETQNKCDSLENNWRKLVVKIISFYKGPHKDGLKSSIVELANSFDDNMFIDTASLRSQITIDNKFSDEQNKILNKLDLEIAITKKAIENHEGKIDQINDGVSFLQRLVENWLKRVQLEINPEAKQIQQLEEDIRSLQNTGTLPERKKEKVKPVEVTEKKSEPEKEEAPKKKKRWWK